MQFLKLALTLLLVIQISSSEARATNHKPTLAQIEAAKKEELARKAAADSALKRLAKAQGNLRLLTSLANQAQARYLRARDELVKATVIANKADADYQEAAKAVVFTHREIGKLAINAYTSGGGLSDLESVLSANGPQDVIDRISTLENLGAKNKTALTRYKAAETIAEEARKAADEAKEAQRVITVKVAAVKKDADDAKVAQQKEVSRLQAIQDKLQRDLASAKKVRITLEQRRQLAILEETRANEATKVKNQSKIWKTGGPNGKSTSRTTAAQRAQAVEFAKKQVLAGKPYVWGDEGPSAFDCSGLVYAAYKSAGLGWPIWDRLNSGLYYTYTKQIPLAEMQPGDLLFYSYKGTI